MKTQILMIAITAGFVLPTGGFAQGRIDFAALDANGDGQLTLEEMQAASDVRFVSVDTDGNGVLSEQELIAAGQSEAAQRVAKMLERLDTNEDGALSQREIEVVKRRSEISERRFDRIDADDSGTLSEEEFENARERRGGRDGGKKRGGGRDRG